LSQPALTTSSDQDDARDAALKQIEQLIQQLDAISRLTQKLAVQRKTGR
jgi:pyrroloquinoline quinone (PQQ) biosynthesis protein C